MKQPRKQEKRLILAALLHAHAQVAETIGYLSSVKHSINIDEQLSNLNTSLQSIKTVIQLVSDGG